MLTLYLSQSSLCFLQFFADFGTENDTDSPTGSPVMVATATGTPVTNIPMADELVTPDNVCANVALEWNAGTAGVLSTIVGANGVLSGLQQYQTEGLSIGSITALIPEASDAAAAGITPVDGQSGDTDFAFGNLKALATVGERSVCDASLGQKIVGVPDGLGAYLIDDETVRVVVQSESYGPLRYES
jgi:hypothetical protein